MGFLSRLFGKPSNYPNDPYGFLTNQAGHAVLGAGLTACAIVLTGWLFGVSLDVLWLIFAPFAFLTVWEIGRQGWQGTDTVEDALFFGAGSYLGYAIPYAPHPRAFLAAWSIALALMLVPGVVRRLK